MEKLFETGSLLDKPRSCHPTERVDFVDDVDKSIEDNFLSSTRKRSAEMDIPRTTLRRILKDDLELRPWKPCQV
jgi:hypothetical protein